MDSLPITDAHVHFWDPRRLGYPWLEGLPELHRPFLPDDFWDAAQGAPVERLVFVEANVRPAQHLEEVAWVEALAASDERIAGLVAYANVLAPDVERVLRRLGDRPLVKGIRHNIQGHAADFARQTTFVEGVRAVGAAGFPFDLCVTHDQLGDVVALVEACPDVRFMLDHGGKPDIREGRLDPWQTQVDALAARPNVWCKVSGLLTEAAPGPTDLDRLRPYLDALADAFGPERLVYGGDWPVLTLAGTYAGWLERVEAFTAEWSPSDRRALLHENAGRFYDLG